MRSGSGSHRAGSASCCSPEADRRVCAQRAPRPGLKRGCGQSDPLSWARIRAEPGRSVPARRHGRLPSSGSSSGCGPPRSRTPAGSPSSRFVSPGARDVPEDLVAQVYWGALVHDVGELNVQPALFHTDATLAERERIEICQHTIVGARWLAGVPELAPLAPFARWHHERFDALGYPDGATAQQVPLTVALVAVCDAWDALTEPLSVSRAAVDRGRDRGDVAPRGSAVEPDVGAVDDRMRRGRFSRVRSGRGRKRRGRLS